MCPFFIENQKRRKSFFCHERVRRKIFYDEKIYEIPPVILNEQKNIQFQPSEMSIKVLKANFRCISSFSNK